MTVKPSGGPAIAAPQREAQPPPAGFGVRLAPYVLIRDEGRLLIGGVPPRLIRLNPVAASMVKSWHVNGRLGESQRERILARRLLDGGLLVPEPDAAAYGSSGGRRSSGEPAAPELAVVVPVYGHEVDLDHCLQAVRLAAPNLAELVVVDDASPDGSLISEVARAHGAVVVRHAHNSGPAAARNTGISSTTAELLAFVDVDVTVDVRCLQRLIAHFADPKTAAVAPRVLSSVEGGTAISRYETRHSALDLGSQPGPVKPGSPVSFVPSATLLVRREALHDGYDDRLRVGEDVDLVWRLVQRGWNVWYDPVATVRHRHRETLVDFTTRRFAYATSVGILAQRYPSALSALNADLASATVLNVLLGRRRLSAVLIAALFARILGVLAPRTQHPVRLAGELTYRSVIGASNRLGYAVRRPWLPLVLAAASKSRATKIMLAAALMSNLTTKKPSSISDAALMVSEDVIAASGIWWACLRERTVAPLILTRSR